MENPSASRWFTLVELVVVISILSILSTLGFFSLSSYGQNARDSKRLSDIENLKQAFSRSSLYNPYPTPSAPTKTVSYSGQLAFTEGSIGNSVMPNLQTIQTKPSDPKFPAAEYGYSVGMGKFQIATVLEDGGRLSYFPGISTAYASMARKAYVTGDYTGSTGSVTLAGTTVSFPLASLVTSDSRSGAIDYAAITASGTFLTNGATNDVPFSYKIARVTIGGF